MELLTLPCVQDTLKIERDTELFYLASGEKRLNIELS